MVYYANQPKPVPRVRMNQFENHAAFATAILSEFREDLKQNPVLFLGVQPESNVHAEVWKQLLIQNQEAGIKYDIVVAEQSLAFADTVAPNEKISAMDNAALFVQGVQAILASRKRVAILVPSTYSAQMIEQNLVNQYQKLSGQKVMSLSLVDFPRHREDERSAQFRCIVEAVDQSGLGPFGCTIMQAARANYRKRFEIGKQVGLVDQISLTDHLVLYSTEK